MTKSNNKKIENFVKKAYIYIGYFLKISLVIYLILSFRRGNPEPVFWFMAISLALAGILITKKGIPYVSTDLIYATIFFLIAIVTGGSLTLFGEGFSAYHIFIKGHFMLESILTGLTFGIYSATLIGILFGSMYFIDAIIELLVFLLKKDKRPIKIF